MAENHLQLADVIIASLRPQSMNSIPVSVHPVGHELIEKGHFPASLQQRKRPNNIKRGGRMGSTRRDMGHGQRGHGQNP
jgi:hypothetical protein